MTYEQTSIERETERIIKDRKTRGNRKRKREKRKEGEKEGVAY